MEALIGEGLGVYGVYALLGAVSLVICWRAVAIGRLLGVIDVPDGRRKAHPKPTPLVGGMAVVAPVFGLGATLAFATGNFELYGSLVIAIASFFTLGFADDRIHLRPSVRLFLSIMLCVMIVSLLPSISVTYWNFTFLDGPVSIQKWHLVFTVLVLIGFIYAFNMTDGMNGVAMGLALIWALLLLNYAPAELLPLVIALAITLSIAFLFNLRGRLFLGDSGAYALSIVVALLTNHSYNANSEALNADIVVVWFMIPVVDCLRLMVARAIKGRSPFSPDTQHLHHILCRFVPPAWALACYLLLAGMPGVLALLLPGLTVAWFALGLICYAAILVAGVRRPVEQQL